MLLIVILLCILAYLVIGIVLATVFQCAGLGVVPGVVSEWDNSDIGMFIGFWWMMLAFYAVAIILKLPIFISKGMAQACAKRKSR